MLAVRENDQSSVVAGAKDGETGACDQPAQCRRAVAIDGVYAGTFDDGLDQLLRVEIAGL